MIKTLIAINFFNRD